MGATHKGTPAKLDKIIRFIHAHQEVTGKTPKPGTIEEAAGLITSTFSHYRNCLEETGRISVIKLKPFDAKINLRHPDNKRCLKDGSTLEVTGTVEAKPAPMPELLLDDPIGDPGPRTPPSLTTEQLVDMLMARGYVVTLVTRT